MNLYLYRIGNSVPILTIENVISYSADQVVTEDGTIYSPLAEDCELSSSPDCSKALRAEWRREHCLGDYPELMTLEERRAAKLQELSATCNALIVAGFDIELGNVSEHFNLSIEDQSNIANLFRVVELGGTEFPYQADGGVCRIYNAQEIAQIYIAAQTAITTQTTYHNALKAYVQGLDDVEQIAAVQYGMTLPDPYASEVAEKLSVAQTQMNAIVARLGGNA